MLCSSGNVIPGPSRNRITPVIWAIYVLALLCASRLGAQTVATYSFEDGTADGWTSFNGASTPVATTSAAYAGSHSLLTTTGSGGSGGPSISMNTVLLAGAKYTITGYLQLTAGENTTNANFSMKRSDPGCSGGACYDTIGSYQVPVGSSGWVQIGGTYTPSTTETGLVLYAQLVGATSAQSFYLDDVVITETAPPPGGTPVATYTFADGGLDGWSSFGAATLANSASPIPDPIGNTRSLLSSHRTAGYMGPSLNLLNVPGVVAGATYQVSAFILLASADSSSSTVTLSTKTTDCAALSGTYGNIGTSTALSSTVWTKVQGTLTYSNLPGAPTGLVLYIQSSSATDSFYVSGVSIGELAPPPISPDQQDNTGITGTFEDGGSDGWISRIGSSTVSNTTAEAHSGAHSLLTTGRVANYDGPQISVNNKMYSGSLYNASVWVNLLPTDGSSHILNMSLQTTLAGNISYTSMTGYPGVTVLADGNWHQISVTGYTMANSYDQGAAYLYLQTVPGSGNDLVSFYLDDFQLTYVPPPTIQADIPSIYKTFSDFFPIGAAVDFSALSGPHAQLLRKHFDSITPGNDLKWSSVEATKGVYTYANGDALAGEAECNSTRIRGHNLVWATGQQTPSYATGDGTNSAANQAVVTANIQEHIQNEVQHFGNKMYAWDVVNEPLDPTQADCLVHGPFYQVLGSSYLDIAFNAAKEYTPAGTKLFINEYSTTDPARLACLVRVVRELRDRGVPVNAIGHEMHNAINYPTTASIVHAIETIHRQFPDVDQQITELDMSVYKGGDTVANYGNNVPASVLAEQGWLYKKYFDAFRSLKGKISAITLWGLADDGTWLDSFPVVRTDYPLAFDTHLQAKPAYWGIVDPTQLPGYGLKFSGEVKRTGRGQVVLTLTATNGDKGTAYATQINGFELRQTGGKHCSPTITPSSHYPLGLGDIQASRSAKASFTINFAGCSESSRFMLQVPWSSAVYETGIFKLEIHPLEVHED